MHTIKDYADSLTISSYGRTSRKLYPTVVLSVEVMGDFHIMRYQNQNYVSERYFFDYANQIRLQCSNNSVLYVTLDVTM